MATIYKLKRSTVSGTLPTSSDIAVSELAVNLADRKLFTSNGSAVFELGANLTNLSVTGNTTLSGIIANGSLGSAGQVLFSNGSSTYWNVNPQGVTSLVSGNGISGGTITSTGTISVFANTGLVANSTGLHVNNSYIANTSKAIAIALLFS